MRGCCLARLALADDATTVRRPAAAYTVETLRLLLLH
jgi:hypothetical protein